MKEWHINFILIMLSVTTAGIVYLVVAQFNQKEVIKSAVTEVMNTTELQEVEKLVTP